MKIAKLDFPGDPVVGSPSFRAGNAGLIPGQGTKIPHTAGQLSLSTSGKDPDWCRSPVPQLRPKTAKYVIFFFKKERTQTKPPKDKRV